MEVTEFQLSSFKSWKMMLWKCCTQYASTFGKLSSGHRTGKGQISFQSQRKAMPKNAQTTAQLHSSHTLVREKENDNLFQYSCLENPVDSGAWRAAVHRVAQSRTWLKRLSTHACTGEGNGSPLQYSCLEDPRDRGAGWAAICGVAHSWTRLKRLSSSSSRGNKTPFQYIVNYFIMV